MSPYDYVKQHTDPDKKLLSLCCGIGLELQYLQTRDITAVDIAPQYLDKLKADFPHIKTVNSDALEFAKDSKDNEYDVISIIDGIEHMDKEAGIELIKEMKRVAKEKILLFTPQGRGEDGYLKNEPHDAWGIAGADEHQKHKSGWTEDELKSYGFTTLQAVGDTSQHGEPYNALMMIWNK